ncbi:Indoleamine 2,3-dioxygenase [Mycena rebaudengoi]|nr:Indoleamine 2,3-dioxygenase [Mycena rebaudengoi]
MDTIPPDHFLALSRLAGLFGSSESGYDTSTLAAQDFDVDNRSGFMPPRPRLHACQRTGKSGSSFSMLRSQERLQLGDKPGITESEMSSSSSPRLDLRRAHLVLAWIMHFYIHSLPPDVPVVIPAPITVPLLQICAQLQLPPVLTYADTVLYNWTLKTPSESPTIALDNLQSRTLFTGTTDEQEFYLTSARMELRGVEALALMRATMDEAFVGDALARRRIAGFLTRLANVIDDLTVLLDTVRAGCDPVIFYGAIRPWFRGADSDPARRPWVSPDPARGQSALIHALDMFLGVAEFSHAAPGASVFPPSHAASAPTQKSAFLARMQLYMPRHHRAFLNHLAASPRPLRAFVRGAAGDDDDSTPTAGNADGTHDAGDADLLDAYNAAVRALKRFRDCHIAVVTSYIIQPAAHAKRAAAGAGAAAGRGTEAPLKGTGGTDLARFLKDVRDRTAAAVMEAPTLGR